MRTSFSHHNKPICRDTFLFLHCLSDLRFRALQKHYRNDFLSIHILCTCFFPPDPIEVGYERTVYTTSEGEVRVELCAVIFQPTSEELHETLSSHQLHEMELEVSCCTEAPVIISSGLLSFASEAGVDYESDSAELTFVRGSMRECHTVNIIPDEECEQPPENFFSVLRLVRGSPVIAINPSTTEVVIDDSNEPDCSESNLNLIQN